MELGISSLAYISDIGQTNEFKNLLELQLKAITKSLDYAEENGINVVELVIEPPEILLNENQQKFIELIEKYSLSKQIHGPFIDMNLCSNNNYISNASVQTYLETIELCHKIECKILTIHPGFANFMLKPIRRFNKQKLKIGIDKLLNCSNRYGINICLENMPTRTNIMTSYKNIVEVYNFIEREDLSITYDTSHYFICDGNVEQLWEKFHNKIRNIHIVDTLDKKYDSHSPLGAGAINFKHIFEIINSYNYNGPLIIELSSAESLTQSINFINKFL
jgi:sugar phosphate isomerase/epimerase